MSGLALTPTLDASMQYDMQRLRLVRPSEFDPSTGSLQAPSVYG